MDGIAQITQGLDVIVVDRSATTRSIVAPLTVSVLWISPVADAIIKEVEGRMMSFWPIRSSMTIANETGAPPPLSVIVSVISTSLRNAIPASRYLILDRIDRSFGFCWKSVIMNDAALTLERSSSQPQMWV